jgi:hypothetical protein
MSEIKWKGPKEWRPERWPGSPLLSAEENRRIGLIIGESRKASPAVTPEDVTWLCGIIRRTAYLSPDDYQFPKYLALVHQIKCEAYAIGYKETLQIQSTVTLKAPDFPMNSVRLMDHETSDQPHDATLIVRPYIRINSPADAAAILLLRKSVLKMRIDNISVLRTPVDPHLILPDGSFFGKNRWKVMGLDHMLYLANQLGDDQKVDANAIEGIFCANGSLIQIDILFDLAGFQGELTVTTGLVAARYTTKSHDG